MAVEIYTEGLVQAPLLHLVAQEEILAEEAYIHRRNDCNYLDDEPQPDTNAVADLSKEALPDSFYVKWEEELSNTIADVYIDEVTMKKLFAILYGVGGYFMLKGMTSANSGARLTVGSSKMKNSEDKLQRQTNEIQVVLSRALESAGISEDQWPQKTDKIIEAISDTYSGKQNEEARENKKLDLGLGRAALKEAS